MTGATMMSATRSEGSVLVRASVDRLGRAIDEVAAVDGASPEPDVSAAIDALLDLDDVVPGGLQNPDLKDLLRLTVDLRKAVHAGDQARAMELRAYCRLLLRRIFDHSLVATWDDPAAAFAQITGALSTASIKDLARLLGVSAKTISTWRAGGRIERGAPGCGRSPRSSSSCDPRSQRRGACNGSTPRPNTSADGRPRRRSPRGRRVSQT